MSDFYFNKENDYSEENTSDDEDFGSPILHIFQSDPGQKKRVVMRTMRKKIVKQSVIRRYSSISILKNFANFTGKKTCDSLLDTIAGLRLARRDSTQVFSVEICEIFKTHFFTEQLKWLLFKPKIYIL